MAVNTQIITLDVYRDGDAPFDVAISKRHYTTPKQRSFQTAGLKDGIYNVVEGGVTYGKFNYYNTDSQVMPEEVLTIQASGTIATAANL